MIVPADVSKMPGQHPGKFQAARDGVVLLLRLTIADRLLHLFCHVRIDVDLEDLLEQTVDDGRPFGPVDGPVDSLALCPADHQRTGDQHHRHELKLRRSVSRSARRQV